MIAVRALSKSFITDRGRVDVLKEIDLDIRAGERIAVVGASGAGKTTLMHLLGGLDQVSSGKIRIADTELSRLSETRLGNLRNRHLGFIYQFHHLLPEFSALENIAMPLLIRRQNFSTAYDEARSWLVKVGLEARADHKPGELSGGERQRVALARALVTRPDCLLADEPTGNLDQHTAAQMLELMLGLNQEMNTALVVVTHDLNIAQRMQFRWHMHDGVLTPEA